MNFLRWKSCILYYIFTNSTITLKAFFNLWRFMAMGLLGSFVLYDVRSSNVLSLLGSQVLNDLGSSRGQVLKGNESSRIVSHQRFWVFKGPGLFTVLSPQGSSGVLGPKGLWFFQDPRFCGSWDLLGSSESWVLVFQYVISIC